MLDRIIGNLITCSSAYRYPKTLFISKRDFNLLISETDLPSNARKIYTLNIVIKSKGAIEFE